MHNDGLQKKFQVRVVDSSLNYWVVRAGEDAAYLSHFKHNNLVAIGHLDKMEFLPSDIEDRKQLLTLLSKYQRQLLDEKNSKASATNKSGQVYRFITEMKVGDIIISLDERQILTGVITSNAYKDNRQKVIRSGDGAVVGSPLTYSLRRNVSWGNPVSRHAAPAAVRSSLRANQAVFCVSEHWQTLNHWLSVIFTKDDAVYFSSKIMQTQQISNFDVSQFSRILNIFEAVSSALSSSFKDNIYDDAIYISEYYTQGEIIAFIDSAYARCLTHREFQLKTQQSFMSPGDYWGSLTGDKVKNVIFIMAFCALFNCEAVFADVMDMEIADLNKDAVNTLVEHIKEKEGFDHVEKGLKIKLPKPHQLSDSDNSSDTTPEDVLEFPTDEASDIGEI
ncbi:TPA: hypothetical protein ACSP2B_003770 [Aeromonas veronii]|uniref:hypothetical protein n=1 Tax=Aeromonas veronii TaxID=654 RepID=UPI0038D31441